MTSLTLLTLLILGADAGEPQPLESALLQVGKSVIKHCEDQGFKNVGVLKFQITKDGNPESDNVGTLNVFLARRLEVALVLSEQEKAKNPIGIIDNATAVAHMTKGANHLTKEGRVKLFEPSYPLAWGKESVKADAFITGLVEVSNDLKTMQIQLLIFDKTDNKLRVLLKPFTTINRPELLAEMGESYNTRGAFDNPNVLDDKSPEEQRETALGLAAQLKNKARQGERAPLNPVLDPKAPVSLEVRYDGRVVPFEVRDGRAFVPEPRANQKVELVLKRDKGKELYGVVLKVNGENTVEKQRFPDLQCRRWILDPGRGPLTIDGYQINDHEVERFRVLSVRESKEHEMDYGAEVGTITLTVFREFKGKKKPYGSEEAKEAAVVNKGTLQTKPKEGEPEKPETLGALTARMLEDANRGIIGEGVTEPGAVTVVKFNPDPLPLMTLTVYYRPQEQKR